MAPTEPELTEFNRAPGQMTEEMGESLCRSLFSRIAEARVKVEGVYVAAVDDRSSMRLDDRYLGWWRGGALHRGAINAALDALVTMQSILKPVLARQAELPMTALYPLLRAGIENASLAIYLLAPPERDERLRRALGVVADEAELQKAFATSMGYDAPATNRDAVRAEVSRLIALRPSVAPVASGRVSYTDVVKKADAYLASDPAVVNSQRMKLISWWQLLSGLSHGKQWAFIEALERSDAVVDAENESASVRMTSSVAAVALGLLRAVEALEGALRLYGRRSKQTWAQPEDAAEPGIVPYREQRREDGK